MLKIDRILEAFMFSLEETHNKPLTRLTSESCHIHGNKADIPMNSKAQWHQRAIGRVVVAQEIQELPDQEGRRGHQGGRGILRGPGV